MFGLKYFLAENFFKLSSNSLYKFTHPLLKVTSKKNIIQILKILRSYHYQTFLHSVNVAQLSFLISQALELSGDKIIVITIGALLHDIGKIKVKQSILDKTSPLTEEEWFLMKNHPSWGVEIISIFPWADQIKEIILAHHERFDGLGYLGMKDYHIPLGARIISISDAFDAMISSRPYQKQLSLTECWQEIKKHSGTQFDPDLVQTLIKVTSKYVTRGTRIIMMQSANEFTRQAEISLKFSEFELPPMQDVLLIGRKAPIGPEAARRMVNALSPGQYKLISIPDGPIEAVVIREVLLNMIPEETLLPIILDEGIRISCENTVTKAQLHLTVEVKRTIEL